MKSLKSKAIRKYKVVAMSVPIWFNKWGDHNHNGMLFALKQNEENIKKYKKEAGEKPGVSDEERVKHPYYHLVRPLVLRACVGETVKVKFKNKIKNRSVGIHLLADGYDVTKSDGAAVGNNPSTLHKKGECSITYTWTCHHEGVYVFHDAGNLSGMEDGTNLHGLFGALVVEPKGTTWRNPVTGKNDREPTTMVDGKTSEMKWYGDGLYVDVIPNEANEKNKTPWLDIPKKHPEDVNPGVPRKCFREYVIFFHDEPEFRMSHTNHERDICHDQPDLCGNPPLLEHAAHPIMPVSYRAEPMVSRQKELWKKIRQGFLEAPVVHEEQHHSSWLYGDPATPILKAYIGDPVRIRMVDAGVKETHVFHLHLYSWYHDANNRKSPIIDAISIGPLTAHTIVPLWGAGNRQGATGDIIWHCHLYPHFHEGMWGMFRTFDRLQDGSNFYPDKQTPIEKLAVLPDRETPPTYKAAGLGFPNFIEGIFGQRSPLPPWESDNPADIPEGYDYRPLSAKEKKRLEWLKDDPRAHLNHQPRAGWMFNAFKLPEDGKAPLDGESEVPIRFKKNVVHLSVETERFKYNKHCWHDPEGHLYKLIDKPRILSGDKPPCVLNQQGQHELLHIACNESDTLNTKETNTPGSANVSPEPTDPYNSDDKPLFIRANHGDVVTLELENCLPRAFCRSPFDEPLPPCEKYTIPIESNGEYYKNDRYWKADLTPPMQCGLHVHLVKFDPLVCDGASTGWNYISGPRAPYYDKEKGKWRYLRMRYIWWVDEEFGVIFTHDHLFANFRQKRGLFGAMIAEPHGAQYLDPTNLTKEVKNGDVAVIKYTKDGKPTFFREFCFGLGDFVPLYNRQHLPLNEPPIPGGHSDHGVVGVNYRSAPIRERTVRTHDPALYHGGEELKKDPAYCFSSRVWCDPDTPIFHANPGDPIRIRLLQGSHEEQHSFQIHGMRWRRFLDDPDSPLVNQQTVGISETFNFHIDHNYGPGDYLYKFGTSDDLWMGAWGIIRIGEKADLPYPEGAKPTGKGSLYASPGANVRRFIIVAESQEVNYCANPALSDPKGMVYRLLDEISKDGKPLGRKKPPLSQKGAVREPLVLRCRKGEKIEIELHNETKEHPIIEPAAPMVPVDILDRPVSGRVSIHADLLLYDITTSDGCNVGYNPVDHWMKPEPDNRIDQTVGHGKKKIYTWYADIEGPILLQDFADFRNHRHHGLIGALIVEPEDAKINYNYEKNGKISCAVNVVSKTHGVFEEVVLIIQDGLRLFHFGNLSLPMGDAPPDLGEDKPDPTDQGQKAFNYRAQPIGKPHWMHLREEDNLTDRQPLPEPLLYHLPRERNLRLHLLTAADKPRNHSFHLHGHTWPEWPTTNSLTQVGSATSLSAGSVQTLKIKLNKKPADYAFSSGALRWSVSQGLWGILRVKKRVRSSFIANSISLAIIGGIGYGLFKIFNKKQKVNRK
ncbi:hypothetical protein DXT99_01815 [Pontibacter diazotrophicus]|uniref:Uncharacterized protein n=1 Tax=Pontibacter diazotrophicus TaxID=1400979 RepID=A0A3D8LI13_9BACT|nr:multicopper oxidase domain-containing protein [Pontibacter diazotrophicus]RDV16874.1 hypothetical protein DXT99_01815 [Pontibacter diazotrophicus]